MPLDVTASVDEAAVEVVFDMDDAACGSVAAAGADVVGTDVVI